MSKMESRSKKTFAELGYSQMDTAEIISFLNRLLANYMVLQQKLRNFSWNIVGQDFFQLRGQFTKMYRRSIKDTDDIAGRIRLFGQRPASTMAEYMKLSAIMEESDTITSFEMVKIILSDIRTLLEINEGGINAARAINDNGSVFMFQSLAYKLEEEHWILTAWMKQNA